MSVKVTQNAQSNIATVMDQLGVRASTAAETLAHAGSNAKTAALKSMAGAIRSRESEILAANEKDMAAAAKNGRPEAFLDRLKLTRERVESMAAGLEAIAELDDPVGDIMSSWERPNGLLIERVRTPLGVIGIIYESRPNVTADAGGLCMKSGHAVILRGGSESQHSSKAIHACLVEGLKVADLPEHAIQLVPTTDRAAVGEMLKGLNGAIDVIVPRGGKSLIKRVQQEARVPVIGHLEGLCHVYLHESADTEMATAVTLNAKMRRTGICGAAETLLVDEAIATALLPEVARALSAAGCEIRGDEKVTAILPDAVLAEAEDWSTEYLDAIISVRIVADIDAAILHIEEYGSGHTEAIVTDDASAAEKFFSDVDSAILLHNASTQFADGAEFGMGAEIGIATGRIHARGPVGANELTSYKYVVRGNGQVRS